MNDFEKKILEIVTEHPGIKAREIVQLVGGEKKAVNSALYGKLSSYCYQDAAYRWYPIEKKTVQAESSEEKPCDKLLSDVCKYYLNCLSLEENNGISAFLTSKFSLDYTELSDVAIDSSEPNVDRLVRKVSAEKNLVAHIGYPVLIEKFFSSKTQQEYMKIAPVFLFPVEISGGSVEIDSTPHVNMEVIKRYSSKDINSQVYDLIELENDLGLNTLDADIDIDDLASRLQAIRDWQWAEELNPSEIKREPAVCDITQEGIYNRAIFIVTEKSPYTVGLEAELLKLTQLEEKDYKDTALYDWIHNSTLDANANDNTDAPLLEVLPMNTEQENAVKQSMTDRLTIVTGPPGTGKSQVVTNIVINSAWEGKNVLFTSKNNKAVDVVETRVNALGNRPIMLRIGGAQNAFHLAELIEDLLSCTADQSDLDDYNLYMSSYREKVSLYKELKREKDKTIGVRNNVDHLEQRVCQFRDKWSEWISAVEVIDANLCEDDLKSFSHAYEEWDKSKNSIWGKLFWFAIGKKKTQEVEAKYSNVKYYFEKYGWPITSNSIENIDRESYTQICQETRKGIFEIRSICEYKDALKSLQSIRQFETIDLELMELKKELADIAVRLWKKWLITRPIKIDAACRMEMNEYVSAMRLIGEVTNLEEFPDIRKKFNSLQKKMTNFLPCWAVTSLSAKGRVPFEPGVFDLVVIDEASQCDIASVLPMLYRAKRAVIIGDPKQLSHISTISKTQDLSLIQKYGVSLGWSYSANSLYALASSISSADKIISLRDHHRSFADIIEFSNAEFYDGKLRVATNYSKLRCPSNVEPGIRWIDNIGETVRPYFGGAYNESEAKRIAEELKKLIVDNAYEGSVGVVTPFRAQVEQIEKTIKQKPELESALSRNDFLIDTVHKFQGDEKDVIFFSPVISNGTADGALKFLKNTGNLFNVAITRARAVLIVVGDRGYCSRCGVPYMEHFVQHVNALDIKQEKAVVDVEQYSYDRQYPNVSNADQVSDWERLFYTALFDQGIRTIPQYPVDKYKLDLAIVKGERKLDIEVDGEMYHRDWNGELCYRDQLRNQRLFELGWDVKRFWVYQIRDNLQECIHQIQEWIDNC